MPVQTPDTEIGDAILAAVWHQFQRSLRGYGWVSGDAATAGPGVAVTVPDPTTMWIDGSEVAVDSADNVADIVTHDRHPRWASIVVNADGSVEALMGQPNRPLEVGGEELEGRNAARPQPPIVTDSDRVLHSLVWVPANASAIESEHILDRRVDARVDAYNFNLDPGYTDAEAVAAVESEDPLDLAGVLNTGGNVNAGGEVHATTRLRVDDGNAAVRALSQGGDAQLEMRGANGTLGRVLLRQDASDDVYFGDLDASGADAWIRAGGANVLRVAQTDQSVRVVGSGDLRCENGVIRQQGTRVATQDWAAPSPHGNDDHAAEFLWDGDGIERTVWVIENGASDPAGAAADDIIFEKEA